MSDVSAIEWTDATWNPVTGCTRVSPGCANCYIERTPPFRMSGRVFARVGNEETTGVQLHPDRLEKPLRWRKPRRVFVCSLADLFHDDVAVAYLVEVFAVMALAREHTFQVLTKRPERMAALLTSPTFENSVFRAIDTATQRVAPDLRRRVFRAAYQGSFHRTVWPLPNVWFGVSIENARYTWRADVLREIPAAVRFVSAEPLLGSLFEDPASAVERDLAREAWNELGNAPAARRLTDTKRAPLDLTGIDWLIAGGESGPGARPMHPDWARELRDACLATGCQSCEAAEYHDEVACSGPRATAFFFKQHGEWAPIYADRRPNVWIASDGTTSADPWDSTSATRRRWLEEDDGALWRSLARVYRLGKKRAGRLLDGREWNEYPEARRG